jgi:deoxycytidine triphosphate deaminase
MVMLSGKALKEAYRGSKLEDMSEKDMRLLAQFIVSRVGGRGESTVHRLAPDITERHIERAMPDLPQCLEEERILSQTYFSVDPFRREELGITSFDYRLGGLIGVCDTVLGKVSEADILKMEHYRIDEGQPFQFKYDLNGNRIYYFVSRERVGHSRDLEVEVHAKSTTGRVGCHVRGVGRTKEGRLITLLQPLAFNLNAEGGRTSFSQGVVRYAGTKYATVEEIKKRGLVSFGKEDLGRFVTSLGAVIRFDTKLAYAAKRTDEPIDMSASGTLDWRNFWERIEGNHQLVLDGRRLYLLGSEGVIVLNGACGIISKEKDTFNGLGGFGCLAGVIQPGFIGEITMEPFFQNKTKIKKGDVAGHVLVDMVEGKVPEEAGEEMRTKYGGDYQHQKAPRLPKMFRED